MYYFIKQKNVFPVQNKFQIDAKYVGDSTA